MVRYMIFFVSVVALMTPTAQAGFITYTDRASFLTALQGLSLQNIDFNSIPAGTFIPTDSGLGNVKFTYNFLDASVLMITDQFATTSPPNYLGTSVGGNYNQLVAGDSITLSITQPVKAIGMSFITADPLFDNDIWLQTILGTAFNSATPQTTFPDGGRVYFVGLLSTDQSFTSADIRFASGAEGAFLYNIDDITTASGVVAVPEPGSLILSCCSGGVFLGVIMCRWKRTSRPSCFLQK